MKLALLFSTYGMQVAALPQPPCDSELKAPPGDPYGYRLRGDRCEGEYIQPVSSSALALVSFTSSFEDFDVNQTNDLTIRWRAQSVQPHIRARALTRGLHYRMDAIAPGAASSMKWPTGLLRALGINRSNLGVLAWTTSSPGVPAKPIYLPVQVGQTAEQAQRTLRLSILPGIELSEVYVSLAAADKNGHAGAMLRDGSPLGYSYYPPDQAVSFSLPVPDVKGLFYLEIATSLKSGGSATLPLWFSNP